MESNIERKVNFLPSSFDLQKSESVKRAFFYVQMVFISAFSLIAIGLAFILSSTYSLSLQKFGSPFFLFIKQLMWVAVGIVFMYVFTKIDTSLYIKYVKLILLFGIIFSLLPFLPNLGKSRGDAFRWVNLGFISISASEVVKVILILYISVVLSKKRDKKSFFNSFLPMFIVSVLFFIIISLQLDVSMAFLILITSVIMMYVGGIPLFQIVLTVLVSSFFILFLGEKFPYIQNRVFAFLDPWSDPFGRGYHLIYMLKSFQSGIFGVGIGNGTIKLKLPEAHTDSIFSVIGEEAGLFGVLLVILFMTLMFFYSLKLAMEVRSIYRSLLVIGFSSTVSIWGLVSILVNIGLLPPTGTNLPLLSYGGANLVTSLIGLGIIYRCYKEYVKDSKRETL